MAATPNFTTEPDVRLVLGKIGTGTKLADAGITVASMIPAAHAEVLDKLTDVYGSSVPALSVGTTPDAWEVVRWAEARLCAANILDILRASLDTESEIPERLRRSAWDALARGLPGLRPGDDPEGGGTVTWSGQPAHSSSTPVSNFPNPYEDVVVDYVGGWIA